MASLTPGYAGVNASIVREGIECIFVPFRGNQWRRKDRIISEIFGNDFIASDCALGPNPTKY